MDLTELKEMGIRMQGITEWYENNPNRSRLDVVHSSICAYIMNLKTINQAISEEINRIKS